jgi:Rha family phage regulatory protein
MSNDRILNDPFDLCSLAVAEMFEKRHADVVRAIKRLDCSPGFHALNFQEMVSDDRGGPTYHMTIDGFSFLVMGFTGMKAAQWKEEFIDSFNILGNMAPGLKKEVEELRVEVEALKASCAEYVH